MSTTVAVAPTETVVLTLDVSGRSRVCIQVDNLDASQTFNGAVYVRIASAWCPTTLPDFQGLAPLASVAPVLDTGTYAGLQLRGTMSGIGGNVGVSSA